MASIGGVTVFSVRGGVSPLAMGVELFERPGVHGHGGVQLGLRGEPYELTVLDDSTSNANRESVWSSLRALSGSVVTVVDDHGNTYSSQMVLGWSAPERMDCLVAVGGRTGGKHLLRVVGRLQAV